MLSCACLLFLYHMTHSVDSLMLPLWMGIFGFLLAALLQSHTGQYQRLDMLFRQSQDDSRENHLLLTEKNKALLEKQDYEIYTATLRERNRIAREIHDSVGHVLSRSILLLGAARAVNRQTELCPVLDNLDVSLNSAMDSIRSSVHDLHDESVNLEETVRSLTDGFTFCPVLLRYDMGRKVPREVKYCLISILKEALSNVMRHSNASQVCVTMQEHPALYQLCVEDNGTGAAPGDCSKESGRSGIGLTNIQDRVRSLDGILQISAETGFRIFITIPKKPSGNP
nr:histidine kinase [uncultured Schaedlerella sp.]